MWSKTENIQACKEAVKMMFAFEPLELTRWLLTKDESLASKDESISSTIVSAKYIHPGNKGEIYAVPEKKEKAEGAVDDIFKKGILDLFTKTAEKDGIQFEPVTIDRDEMDRQTMSKGGCDIEIIFTFKKNDGPKKSGILALPLLTPPDDGSELYNVVMSTLSWQLLAFENYILNPQIKAKNESKIDVNPVIIYKPLFLWHGTGLKDCGDFVILMPEIDENMGVLGELINSSRESDYLKKRRKNNLGRQKAYEKKDKQRREAAKKRAALMGDPMITEQELDEICPTVNIDKDEYSLWIQWTSKRIWEIPYKELLEELPACGLGLAFFGYTTEEENSMVVYQQCLWKLRSKFTELNLSDKEKNRAIFCLAATAKIWLSDEEVVGYLKKFKLNK